MSIHRRGDSWVVSYWENGRQRNKFFGARRHGSSEIALQAAQDWQDQRKLSIPDPNAALTLRDLIFIYIQSRPELHRRTKEAIARALRGPAASFADKVADQLTRADLETLRQAARQGGAGPNTINKQQAYIRAALAWGVEQGHLNINPWGGFKRLKAPRYQMQATLEDFRRIVQVAPDWMAWALAVCYSTAARWGLVELFGLRWTAFDWRAGTVGIVQGKTGRPKVVPVSQGFLAEAWRRFQADRAQGFAMVVHRGDGRPIRSYRAAWLKALKLAGIDKPIRPYDIRHCVATMHLDSGTPLPVVAGLLGHSSPQVTAMVYAHAIDGRARQAVEALPGLTD
jgi:integrase